MVVEEGYHRRASNARNMVRFRSGRWPRDTWELSDAARVVVVIRGEGRLALWDAGHMRPLRNCAKLKFYANGHLRARRPSPPFAFALANAGLRLFAPLVMFSVC